MRRICTAIVATAGVTLLLAAAHAELAIDPGAIAGIERFTYVRAVISADSAVMAWLAGNPFDGAEIFSAHSADGSTWGQPVQVSGRYPDWVLADYGAGEFSLTRATNGTYWLAWSAATGWRAQLGAAHGSADAGASYVAAGPDIWIASSADGRTWSVPQAVALAPTPDRHPGIIEMPLARIGVIWVSQRDGNDDLSLSFEDAQGKWGEAVQITADPARDDQYELAHVGAKYVPDSRGRLTLAWVSERGGEPQVWTAISTDGRAWSQPVRVSSGAGLKGFLTIEDAAVGGVSGGAGAQSGYNLYWSTQVGADEQRRVSRSPDFVSWSEPELAPVGK